jgi:hypothetical protein
MVNDKMDGEESESDSVANIKPIRLNGEDDSHHLPIPKLSIKRKVNADSHESEFMIEKKTAGEGCIIETQMNEDDESLEHVEDEEICDRNSEEEYETSESSSSCNSEATNEDESATSGSELESEEKIIAKPIKLKIKPLKNPYEKPQASASNIAVAIQVKSAKSNAPQKKAKNKPEKTSNGESQDSKKVKGPRALTSYNLFCDSNKQKVAEKHPKLSINLT